MFERLVQTSDAMRACDARLIPALCGCKACNTTQMIAAPVLGACPACGTELTVLSVDGIRSLAETSKLPPVRNAA